MTALPKLAAPAKRALESAGVRCLEDLGQRKEAEILALHGVGPNAMRTLREALELHSLRFLLDD